MILFALLPTIAFSATITVTDFGDTGTGCTLREAFAAAQSNDGANGCAAGSAAVADTIVLAAGFYAVTGTPIVMNTPGEPIRLVGVSGGGANRSTIRTSDAAGVIAVTASTLEIEAVTLQGGTAAIVSCGGANLRLWDTYLFGATDGYALTSACDTAIERCAFGINQGDGVVIHDGPGGLRMAQTSFIDNTFDGAALTIASAADVQLSFNTFTAANLPSETMVLAQDPATTLAFFGNAFSTDGIAVQVADGTVFADARYNVLRGTFPIDFALDTNQDAPDLTFANFAFYTSALVPTRPLASGFTSIPPALCPPLDARKAPRPQGDGCEPGAHENDEFETLVRVVESDGCAAIVSGLDNGDGSGTARDHVLEDGEIDTTDQICPGTVGPVGPAGPPGADGASSCTVTDGASTVTISCPDGSAATVAKSRQSDGGCASTTSSPLAILFALLVFRPRRGRAR